MPSITVYNLHSQPITIPGGYYTGLVDPGSSKDITVPDTQEFLGDSRIQRLIDNGYIRAEFDSGDTSDRPLAVYSSANLPSAGNFVAGTLVWNSTTRELLESDGTSWSRPVEGGSMLLTAGGSDISTYRFVGVDTSGDLVTSPAANERFAGVSAEAISSGSAGKVITGGKAKIMASADLAANDELVAALGGFAAPYTDSVITLGSTVAGADASDDIDQSNLPDQVTATCSADETGNTLVIYGTSGGAYVKETITFGAAGSYTSTNTYTAVYCLETTAQSVGTIDIRDASLAGLLIPQIAAATAARKYGAIEPDSTTDSQGHEVQIQAGGVNASDVVLLGTDYAGNEQAEVVTLNGNNWVDSTLAYRALNFVLIGADGIAWNAGATSEYDQQVAANEKREIRAYAPEAATTAGTAADCLVLPQNQFLVQGESPVLFYKGVYSANPAAGSATHPVPGLTASDVVLATLNDDGASGVTLDMAAPGTDQVTLTWSANPAAVVDVSILVFRP